MKSNSSGHDPRSEHFTTDSLGVVTLHTLHHGNREAPKLVLLHGGGANAHWWDHLAPTLAEAFHVVALDFRGHGDSDPRTPWSPAPSSTISKQCSHIWPHPMRS